MKSFDFNIVFIGISLGDACQYQGYQIRGGVVNLFDTDADFSISTPIVDSMNYQNIFEMSLAGVMEASPPTDEQIGHIQN